MDTREPEAVKGEKKAERDGRPKTLGAERNETLAVRADRFPDLLDFYSKFDELDVTADDRDRFKRVVARLGERDAALLGTTLSFTVVRFRNNEGIPTPLPLTLTYADGATEDLTLPAEIWRYAGGWEASKLLVTDREVARVELDRRRETADRDPSDNAFPQEIERARFEVSPNERGDNPMRAAQNAEKRGSTRKAAEELAKRVAEAVAAGRSAGSVLATGTAALDGWGRPFVVLDGAEQGEGGIAQIVSGGPDMAVGGEDDLSFVILPDGTIRARQMPRSARH